MDVDGIILTAGGGADSENTIWPATHALANYVFKTFINAGYKFHDIWYQNPINQFIVDDSTPTKAGFQESITDWAAKKPNTGPLYIYLIGHGAENRFQITHGQVITACEQKSVLMCFRKVPAVKWW